MTQSAGRVAYSRCASYLDRRILRESIQQVLAVQIADFPGGVSGKKIMLKPNLLAWRRTDDVACVHPAFLVESARAFLDAGASLVAILENPAVQTAPAIVRSMGIADELAAMNVKVANFERFGKVASPENVRFRNLEIAQEYQDFDAVCNIAKAKTHGMMTLTLCVKNLFGMVKGSERMGWHLAVGRDFPMFADMLLDIYLTVRPRFNLLDAVVCMEGNGPGSGTPAVRGFIAGASDALAVDASVAPLFGVDDLLLVKSALRRKLLMPFMNTGDAPERNPLLLPDPPGMLTEWGVPLPPYLKGWLRNYVISKPILDPSKCIGCGLCGKMCPPQSLKLKNGKPVFDLPNCIRCYCCQEHCPKGAIMPKKTLPMRGMELFEDGIRFLFGK